MRISFCWQRAVGLSRRRGPANFGESVFSSGQCDRNLLIFWSPKVAQGNMSTRITCKDNRPGLQPLKWLCWLMLSAPGIVLASEYQRTEEIAPESAEDAPVALEDIEKYRRPRPGPALLKDVLKDAGPFWRNSEFELGVRTFDFQLEDGSGLIAEATALGTELVFQSGKWRERLSTVVSWHTSFGLNAREPQGNTGLLAPDQSDLSVISRAYVQYDVGSTTSFRLYRQDFNMPYINRQDIRMIPNTHEAYIVQHPGDTFQWVAGYVSKIKQRDSEDFVPMGEAAGVEGSNAGTSIVGARVTLAEGVTIGATVQQTHDLFTTTFGEAAYRRTLTEDWGMQLGAQYSYQASTGDARLGRFNTYSWGLRSKVSYGGAVLTAAYTRTGDNEIRNPFGGIPGFTSSMLFDFDRRNEEAVRVGLSFNLWRFGLEGIGITTNYTKGRNAESADGVSLPDAEEFEVTADFRPPEGPLEGLWLRVRYADGDRGSPEADRRDVRVIINYTFRLLE